MGFGGFKISRNKSVHQFFKHNLCPCNELGSLIVFRPRSGIDACDARLIDNLDLNIVDDADLARKTRMVI